MPTESQQPAGSQLRIAMVVGSYHGLSGACTHVQDLCKHLAQRGVSSTVLAPDVHPEESSEGIAFVRVRDYPLVPQLPFYFTALAGLCRRRQVDVIHSQGSVEFLAALAAARMFDVPTVLTVQGSIFARDRHLDYSPLGVRLLRFANRFSFRRADRLICISREMRDCALYTGAQANRIVQIPNPIDLASFTPSVQPVTPTNCSLFVGALRPQKGVQHLLRAVPIVADRVPDVRFILVGDGPERQRLESMAEALGLRGKVQFEGRQPREQLARYYQSAFLSVVPSLSEPQGIVVLEALACGVPVVGSNVGGIPEMVQHGVNGLLVFSP